MLIAFIFYFIALTQQQRKEGLDLKKETNCYLKMLLEMISFWGLL